MGRGNKGQGNRRAAKPVIQRPHMGPSQNNSKISTSVLLRPLAEEKCRVVTDSDWEELTNNVKGLDDFKREYSEWSRSLYSAALSFLLFFVTLVIEHRGDDLFKSWYYLFLGVAVITGIIGIVYHIKAVREKEKTSATKKSIQSVLQRIEKKSSEVNFDYNPSDGEYPL